MTIKEMQERKKELNLTYETISERSGVPVATVQKILGGITQSPRFATMQALEKVLKKEPIPLPRVFYPPGYSSASVLRESAAAYGIKEVSSQYTDVYPLLPYKRQGEYTAADRDLLPDDIRTELIDGVIYDMASPLNVHQVIVGEVFKMLWSCIEKSGKDCYLFTAPSDVWLELHDKTIVQPDLYVVCDYSMFGKDGHTKGAPPFVVEVLSPSTRSRDMLLKAYKYCNAGVREYWCIDPKEKEIIVYDYDKDPEGAHPSHYSFDETVPVGLSEGKCSVDFGKVSAVLKKLGMWQ